MSQQRDSAFKQAERLLRQGKVQAALDELSSLSDGNPRDGLLLNRCGDLLVRSGQTEPAIGYYEKLAEQYGQGGFVPKAIAMYKKVLRLEPDRPATLASLGQLYLDQQHFGEARKFFLRAAEGHLGQRGFDQARKVYEKMIALEPDDPRHRVRLAETRAAAGETEEAGSELLTLGESLLGSGRPKDAERAYQRAGELLETRFEAVYGQAYSLAAQGQHEEAEALLDGAADKGATEDCIAGNRAAVLELAGRADDAKKTLEGSGSADAASEYLKRRFLGRGAAEFDGDPWPCVDAVLAAWDSATAVEVLERAAGLEPHGHAPALERLYRHHREHDDLDAAGAALERTIRALRASERKGDANRLLEELREIAPKSSLLAAKPATPAARPATPAARPATPAAGPATPAARPATPAAKPAAPKAAAPAPPKPAPESGPASDPNAPLAEQEVLAAEAPAVPLNPADEEFVGGHLTEAEVLQKYGLVSEALQRLTTVTARFPGHVESLVRLVAMTRSQGDRSQLGEVLVQLAVARRAAGDGDGAREAAREAADTRNVSERQRALLARLGLIESEVPEATAPVVEEAPPPPARETPEPSTVESDDTDDEVEISFDAGAGDAPAEAPATETEDRGSPASDLIEEIAFYRDQGMVPEARQKLQTLRTLGYSGPELNEMEATLSAPKEAKVATATGSGEDTALRLDEGELSDIAAALEADVGDVVGDDAESPPEGEESLEDVFAAFKEQVESEVGSEDYRTHYDLGIAYKEMGLVDDALKEFEIATASPDLFREACSMLALCQRQRGEVGEAVRWYQKALDAPGGNNDELQGLRYELADTLVLKGEDQAALDLFSNILDADPGYRDVESRVSEIRSRIGS